MRIFAEFRCLEWTIPIDIRPSATTTNYPDHTEGFARAQGEHEKPLIHRLFMAESLDMVFAGSYETSNVFGGGSYWGASAGRLDSQYQGPGS